MEDSTKPAETEDERRARLLAEAKTLKAPIDQSWPTDQIETAVAKKRPKVEVAKVEIISDPADKQRIRELESALAEAGDMITAMEASAKTWAVEESTLKSRINNLEGENNRLFNEHSDATLKLFEYEQKAAGIVDNPVESEDFGGPKSERVVEPSNARAARPVASSATVRCVVTKHGHNQLFTGREDGSRHPMKTVLDLPPDVAIIQEGKGFVEIQ